VQLEDEARGLNSTILSGSWAIGIWLCPSSPAGSSQIVIHIARLDTNVLAEPNEKVPDN